MSYSGYREPLELGDVEEEPETPSDRKSALLLVTGILLALVFLLDVLIWFTEQGGIFSVVSAVVSVSSKPAVMDIDENGLRLVFLIIILIVSCGLCGLFDFQVGLSRRAGDTLFMLVVIGSAFVLDGVYGESIITHYMAVHGYSRCAAGDWAHGNGKSRVWFADYVRQGVVCRRRKNTVPEYSPFR
jgi:hypothetical protein